MRFRQWEEKSGAAVCPEMPEKVWSCMTFASFFEEEEEEEEA